MESASLLCICCLVCTLESLEVAAYPTKYYLTGSGGAVNDALVPSMSAQPGSPSLAWPQPQPQLATNLPAVPTNSVGVGGYRSSYHQNPKQYLVPVLVPVPGAGTGSQVQAGGYGPLSSTYSGAYPESTGPSYSGSYPGLANSYPSGVVYPGSISSTYLGGGYPGYIPYIPPVSSYPSDNLVHSSSGSLDGALSPGYPIGISRISSANNLSVIPVATVPADFGSGVMQVAT